MVRLKDCPPHLDWESSYQADGSGGWAFKGLSLVDWGTAIDILSFPEDQSFCTDRTGVKADPSIECWELRNGHPWTYELDWYGCAGVIHILLFGTYMQVSEEFIEGSSRPTLHLSAHFKRYWQSDMWKRLFDTLLNAGAMNAALLAKSDQTSGSIVDTLDPSLLGPGTDFEVLEQEFPLIREIHTQRVAMEAWLTEHCCKGGKSLRNLLRRVEIALLETHKETHY